MLITTDFCEKSDNNNHYEISNSREKAFIRNEEILENTDKSKSENNIINDQNNEDNFNSKRVFNANEFLPNNNSNTSNDIKSSKKKKTKLFNHKIKPSPIKKTVKTSLNNNKQQSLNKISDNTISTITAQNNNHMSTVLGRA